MFIKFRLLINVFKFLDQIRTSKYKELFNPDQMIYGKEDASNNYARGYYTVGKKMLDPCVERLNKLVEACDGLQGYCVF